jgi:hypothetical protein
MIQRPGIFLDMQVPEWEFVELLRDYLEVHATLSSLFDHFRLGRPCFEEVAALVGDSDSCLLFRLKERCHALFRADSASEVAVRREALFDLAVGSLFHESMKLRENLYQQEVYAPKVELLLRSAPEATGTLNSESFERLKCVGMERTREAMLEAQNLLLRTRNSLKELLAASAGNGLMMRFIVANPERVKQVFEADVSELLNEISGDPVQGYRESFHSYLRSAFYDEAIECLRSAPPPVRSAPDLEDMLHYARGMSMFQAGRYAQSLESLDAWKKGPGAPAEQEYAAFASAAISRIHNLVEESERGVLTEKARRLRQRFEGWVGSSESGSRGRGDDDRG